MNSEPGSMDQHPERKLTAINSMLEGIVAVLLAIKKNHPEVTEAVSVVTKRCSTVIAQNQYADAAGELKVLAQHLHTSWQKSYRDQQKTYDAIAERLTALPLDHFSKKQRDRFNGLLDHLNQGADGAKSSTFASHLTEVMSDFSETIESLHKTSFGDREVDPGEYSKGINVVKKADLAAVTVRMTNDLKRLMSQLKTLHPNDDKINELSDRCSNLDKNSIHFFEMIDMLSECTWLIYRMNDNTIANQRDYLMGLVGQISNFSDTGYEQQGLLDSSENELNEFNDVLTEELERIKNESKNVSSLSDLKQILNQKMELLKDKLNNHVDSQTKLISEQKKQIQDQSAAIQQLKEKGETYKRELKEASEKSLVDHLTEIPNRRAFDVEARKVVANWEDGYIKNLAILIIDIDHFKEVNDTYGHAVGDVALQKVSELIKQYSQKVPNVFCSRYGGEEFAVICHNQNPKKILVAAKSINELISANPLRVDGLEIPLTVSVGTCFFSEKYSSIDSVIRGADRALYRAKETGRDRVWVANRILGL